MSSRCVPDHEEAPTTYFAPAARAGDAEIRSTIAELAENPIIDATLQSFAGLLAILNEERQILATNTALLKMIGVENGEEVLGLRPGEALQCVHAEDHPAGCGTGRFCSSCGAAIAIVTSWRTDRPAEANCVMTVTGDGRPRDLFLCIRSSPIVLADRRYLLLFLRDQTAEQHRAELERTFFHDLGNMIVALQGASELLAPPGRSDQELVAILRKQARRLAREVEIQRMLTRDEQSTYQLDLRNLRLKDIAGELREIFDHHPAAKQRSLHLVGFSRELTLRTDPSLLLRVLMNLLVNAAEATDEGGEVLLRVEAGRAEVTFSTWNHQPVPEEARQRVFQRHFSTKTGTGRGLGCFAVKLFGERYLGGCVGFTSSEAEGTEFSLTLPLEHAASGERRLPSKAVDPRPGSD